MSTPLYRFVCPHCSRSLKAPVAWAGRRGRCPGCGWIVTFPRTAMGAGQSWTAEQFMLVLADEGLPPVGTRHFLDRMTADRLATSLAQGTCADYQEAKTTLARFGDGRLTAKQWRRILLVGARREALRLELDARVAEPVIRAETLFGTCIPSDRDLHGPAAAIMTRYLHFLRRGTCGGCQGNLTGMACVYHDMERFVEASGWSDDRLTRWLQACHEALGLAQAAPETA